MSDKLADLMDQVKKSEARMSQAEKFRRYFEERLKKEEYDRLENLERERQHERDAFNYMLKGPNQAKIGDILASSIVYRTPEMPRLPPVDPDRPTLAERLDRAEAERDEERQKAYVLLNTVNEFRATVIRQAASMKKFEERAERAESIARKVDQMGADLEACRRDMGEKRFGIVTRGIGERGDG